MKTLAAKLPAFRQNALEFCRNAISQHQRAAAAMLLVTLLWSMAGVVTRHLEAARGFELSFWRSSFNALALLVLLGASRGPVLFTQLRRAECAVWLSALCWAAMFTAFMLALTLTSVGNVLVTMALGPLLTAVFARLFLQQQLEARTRLAIAVGSLGVAAMFASEMRLGGTASVAGLLIAFVVPVATATNYTLLQGRADADMPVAVLLGALLSAAVALPLAWPLHAGVHDLGLLALLGSFQLAVPCLLLVGVSRVLPAPEVALIGLMETVFGTLWAWLGAGETPGRATLGGGALVLGALVAKECLPARRAIQ